MAERTSISGLVRNARLALTNRLRTVVDPLRPRLQRRGMEHVVLRLTGSFPERSPQPRRPFPLSLLPWPPPPPSVEAFANALDRLADDRRVKGVIFIVSGLSAGPATVSSLRQAVIRFRKSGKEAVAYLHELGMWPYYLATACDKVIAPESVHFRAAGLWSEAIFLKDTLALVGLEADFEAIAEYKVSPDMFRRSEMTQPHREMLESLLDAIYAEVIGAIAEGRSLAPDHVRELLDTVPLTAAQACDAGLLDTVCYDDALPAHLGTPETPADLVSWDRARRRRRLGTRFHPRRWRRRRAIGVISVEGMIVPGPSRQPPLPLPLPLPLSPTQAGSDTIVQQLRSASQNTRLAALVLHVDSPGGSALASDLIWREVARLRHSKPVVVYMGNQAASGGYYVSAAANAIVAQATTLTGSIGIWGGKIVTRGLFEKVHARREIISRGRAAGLYADTEPFNDKERAAVRTEIGDSYTRFKTRVAQGRGKTDEEVESLARGRVWTGEQALAHGLVDELGDLQVAANRARELAGLDPRQHAPLVSVSVPRRYLLPPVVEHHQAPVPADAGQWLVNLAALLRESTFALAPWQVRIRG